MSTHEQDRPDEARGPEERGGEGQVDLTSYQSPAAPDEPGTHSPAPSGPTPVPAPPPAQGPPGPVQGPPPAGTARPEPAAASARGVHIAWAKLERSDQATVPIPRVTPQPVATAPQAPAVPPPVPQPAAPAPPPHPPAHRDPTPKQAAAPARDRVLEEDYEDAGMPSAIGRLAAVVVTLGLGWALGVALLIWIVARLVG